VNAVSSTKLFHDFLLVKSTNFRTGSKTQGAFVLDYQKINDLVKVIHISTLIHKKKEEKSSKKEERKSDDDEF